MTDVLSEGKDKYLEGENLFLYFGGEKDKMTDY